MKRTHISYYLAAAVAVITLVLYLPSLQNGFVNWDDDVYVINRLQIRLLDPAFFKWAFTDRSLGFWHPLTWISLAVDYAVWGLNPLGYHLTAIVLHAINTFLVTYLAFMLVTRAREGRNGNDLLSANGSFLIIAGVTGVLFGLHPLHVESVVWISERKDLLCALFFLLSVIAYLDYAAEPHEEPTPDRSGSYLNRRYLLSLALFGMALSSKTMAVSLPVVLLLLDWYPLKRARQTTEWKQLLIEKTPFIGLSLAISIVSILSQKAYGALSHIDVPLSSRVLVAFRSLAMYLGKMLYPVDLLPLYSYPKNVSLFSPEYIMAIILTCTFMGLSIYIVKRNLVLLSVWAYYLITLLPVLGIVQVGFFPMADRFTYLPSIGPFLLAGLGAAWIWEKSEALGHREIAAKGLAVVVATSLCVVMFSLTLKQTVIWRNSIDLWSYVIEKEPNAHPVAYHNRGLAFRNAGQLEQALDDINTALEREDREVANIYNSRATVFGAMGRQDKAIDDLNKAITLEPGFADAYTNRGLAYQNIGRIEQAMKDYDTAIHLDSGQSTAYYNRGKIHLESGRIDHAIRDLTSAVNIDPSYADAYMKRGLAFEQVGRADLAFDDYSAAIKADPLFANAYNNRGLLLEKAGSLDEALKDLDRAIELNPKSVEAYTNRGLVFEDMGQFERAVEDHTRVIVIDPADPLSYSNRGIALEKMGLLAEAMKDHQKACDLGYKPGCEAAQVLRTR
ncbi:MAG TPA: tetratricopeptide repeat protein [Nitrospirota bacterium]|nr:tetratricopeptide repeat protein [Nitrospirota bacterium]